MKKIVRALCYPKAHLRLSALEVTFQNKVVVITGASRGIGAAMARLLMPYKVHFIFLARTEEDLDALAEEVHREGSKADCYTIDFRNAEVLAELMFRLKTRYPRVDYLFANAGKSICRSLSASQDRLHDFDRTMAVNYRSMVSLVQTLLPALMASKGRLIYTSSVSLLYPPAPCWAAYHASKGAADLWLRTARQEWWASGVRIRIGYMPLVHTLMADVNPRYVHWMGYSADEAAALLVRLAMGRRFRYIPWWARISAPLARLASPLVNWGYRYSLFFKAKSR